MLVLSGCTGSPDPAPTTTAPLFATEAEAFAAAEATYRAYVDALNAVDLSDPATFEPVFALTAGEANNIDKQGLSGYHASGYIVSGESVVEVLEPLLFNHGTSQVDIAVCLDVSQVELVDSHGQTLVSPDRVDIQSLRVTLEPRESARSRLVISMISGRDGSPEC